MQFGGCMFKHNEKKIVLRFLINGKAKKVFQPQEKAIFTKNWLLKEPLNLPGNHVNASLNKP